MLDSNEGSGSVTADCWWEVNNTKVNEVNTGYQYTNFKLKTTSGISSNTSGKILFNSEEYDIDLYSVGNTSQYSKLTMPSTEGTYPYSVVYNNKTVCAGTIKVVDPASNLTANCAITDKDNNTITAGISSQQIKFKVTNQNTSGTDIKLSFSGKKCGSWDNGICTSDADMVENITWSNNSTLKSEFNLPLTVGTYTYTLKTLSGSKELCSVDFEVKGPEATCKFKYNDNYVTEVDGGTSNIYFDVSDVKNVTNNYTAKLNFNGTSKAIDCGNSNCWNNSFKAPAAESEDKDHEFTLTTADGSHEICKATLTVKGTGGSGGGGSTTPDPGAGGTGTSITITQDYNFESNLHEIQGTVSVTCKNGPNPASTLRCCPKDCHSGTLSSNLIMGGVSIGTSPRLHNAFISCTDGQTVVVKSQDPVYCGVANY